MGEKGQYKRPTHTSMHPNPIDALIDMFNQAETELKKILTEASAAMIITTWALA